MSPITLYQSQLVAGRLTDYEIASATSYSITDGPPDAEFMAVAAAQTLQPPVKRARDSWRSRCKRSLNPVLLRVPPRGFGDDRGEGFGAFS